jgi:hypothetical protein
MTLPRWARFLAGAVVATVALVGLLFVNLGPLTERMMRPGVQFAAAPPPPAPRYEDDAAWSALPGRVDAGDALPAGVEGVDQASAPVDVFYVHPTTYIGSSWNGPWDDPALAQATDRVATGIQATAFNGCCAVYAPRYRQANGTAFYDRRPDGEAAIALAYTDVRAAFASFQARRGAGRPFILAGHSQGSVLLARLLVEEIQPTALVNELVFAVLPGGPVTPAGLAESAPNLRPCGAADDLGCVVAWDARGPAWRQGRYELARLDTRERLCVNPLSWTAGPAPASANLGAVFLEAEDTAPRPGFADASCEGGVLIVRELGAAPRDLPSRVLDYVMGPENYHPMEYQLFFMNLRANAELRVRAALARRG